MTKILTALTFAVALGLSVASASAVGNEGGADFSAPYQPIANDVSQVR